MLHAGLSGEGRQLLQPPGWGGIGTAGVSGQSHPAPGQVQVGRSSDLLSYRLLEMLPNAGVYYFPWEINSSVPEGEALRTFGR